MQTHETARPTGPVNSTIAPDVAAKLLNALLDTDRTRGDSQYSQAINFKASLNFLEECYRTWKMENLKEGKLSSLHLDEEIHNDLRRLKRFFRQVAEEAGKEGTSHV